MIKLNSKGTVLRRCRSAQFLLCAALAVVCPLVAVSAIARPCFQSPWRRRLSILHRVSLFPFPSPPPSPPLPQPPPPMAPPPLLPSPPSPPDIYAARLNGSSSSRVCSASKLSSFLSLFKFFFDHFFFIFSIFFPRFLALSYHLANTFL